MTVNHTECENCFFFCFVLLLCCKKSYQTVKAGDNLLLLLKKNPQCVRNPAQISKAARLINGTQCAMPYA